MKRSAKNAFYAGAVLDLGRKGAQPPKFVFRPQFPNSYQCHRWLFFNSVGGLGQINIYTTDLLLCTIIWVAGGGMLFTSVVCG